jgi:hypothetical protein
VTRCRSLTGRQTRVRHELTGSQSEDRYRPFQSHEPIEIIKANKHISSENEPATPLSSLEVPVLHLLTPPSASVPTDRG